MIKHLNYGFILCIFLFSCSKNLSSTDLKLEGNWKFVKFAPGQLITGGMSLDEIEFEDHEFKLSGMWGSDAPPISKKISVSGKYYSDSLCIYFIEMEGNKNFIQCNGERDTNNNYTRTVRYKFKEDTLLFSIYERKQDMDINKGCLPTHYFLKHSDK